jgi:hypothetical protein
MSDLQTDLFQLFGHPRLAVATKAETRLSFDVRQRDQPQYETAGLFLPKMRQSAHLLTLQDLGEYSQNSEHLDANRSNLCRYQKVCVKSIATAGNKILPHAIVRGPLFKNRFCKGSIGFQLVFAL